LEGGAASSDDEDAGHGDGIPKQPVDHSYAAEQQELKKAFLQAAEQALDEQGDEDAAAKGLIKKQRLAAAAGGDGDAAAGSGKEQQVNEVRFHIICLRSCVLNAAPNASSRQLQNMCVVNLGMCWRYILVQSALQCSPMSCALLYQCASSAYYLFPAATG
jgi:hypothetical protein